MLYALQVKAFSYGICLIGYSVALTHPVIHGAFIFPEKMDNVSFFEKMQMQAKTCFLMEDFNGQHKDAENEHFGYTLVTFFLTIIHIIMIIPSTILVHMLDLFALLTTICCWNVVNRFVEHCKQLESSVETDEELPQLTDLVNIYFALPLIY